MSDTTKRMADAMRATAQCLEILGPFPDEERLKIIVSLIVLLKPDGTSGVVDRLMERMKKAGA